MKKREFTQTRTENYPSFLGIVEASTVTGLSQYYLRQGCRSGNVPCVRSGRVYLVNVPALLRKLGAETV